MPDAHNDLDDGFHEIQLSGKQLVFLFMATTVVAVVIFLCGVQVGRNVKTDRTSDAVDALAAASGAAAGPVAPPVPSPASAASPPAEAPPPAPDADDSLSYGKRLQSTSAPKDQVKPQAAPPKAAAPRAAAAPVPAVAGSTAPRPGNWIVQVNALKDRGAAENIAHRLASKGYPAFVLDPGPGAPAIYRVQVGRYVDRRDAEQIARKLEKDEQYKPIIHSAQ